MKPKKLHLTTRYNVLRKVVSDNPHSTAKELRRIIVGDEAVSNQSKKDLNYNEIMRRLNECCVKGDKRRCTVLKRDVFTWIPALQVVK
jgi:hypothetical protein